MKCILCGSVFVCVPFMCHTDFCKTTIHAHFGKLLVLMDFYVSSGFLCPSKAASFFLDFGIKLSEK